MHEITRHENDPKVRARWTAMFVGLLAIASFFLIAEHRAHLAGAAPYLLSIAAALFCMLGHRHGGHGGHGGHGRHGGHDDGREP